MCKGIYHVKINFTNELLRLSPETILLSSSIGMQYSPFLKIWLTIKTKLEKFVFESKQIWLIIKTKLTLFQISLAFEKFALKIYGQYTPHSSRSDSPSRHSPSHSHSSWNIYLWTVHAPHSSRSGSPSRRSSHMHALFQISLTFEKFALKQYSPFLKIWLNIIG